MNTLVPISLKEANAFVSEHHRHHKPVTGHKFSLGCVQDGQLAGVAVVGRPAADLCPPQMKLRYEKQL